MKKKGFQVLLLALLCLSALTVSAAAAGLLSDGLAVMAGESPMIKGAVAGDTVRFSAADFKAAMGIRRFDGITLTSLPAKAEGTLYFGETTVAAGITVPRESLSSLTFVPTSDKVKEAVFTFTCDSYAGGAEIACTIRFAERLNYAPTVRDVAASRLVSTYADHAVEGTLCAADPEGDALEFIVVEMPERGTLTLLDRAHGDFRYTPAEGYTGRDEFTFVVRDVYGNYSEAATVSVTVAKKASDLDYADMVGAPASLPALVLANEGIMLGTLQGDGMYFFPEGEVTRGEFLTMAMKAAGMAPRAGLTNTVFDDNDEIPTGLRPYVAAAQEAGYVIGNLSERGLTFESDTPISRGEAAVILSRILRADTPVSTPLFPDEGDVTSRTHNAVMAMCAMGVYSRTEEGALAASALLDRATAAEMLYATLLACK